MNPFENPIPKNPKELGQQHRIQEEKEKVIKKEEEQKKKTPFDSINGDNSPEAKDYSREEINFNLINKIQLYINETRKIIAALPPENQKRLTLEEQIENNEVTLETLLSKVSPTNMEKLYENNKKPE